MANGPSNKEIEAIRKAKEEQARREQALTQAQLPFNIADSLTAQLTSLGIKPTSTPDPYEQYGLDNDATVDARYANYYDQYKTNQQGMANNQIASKNASYDRAQNANYINYMLAQKALPEQMARLGLSGGASESSALRQNTNYMNTRFNTEVGRQNDINAINQTMNTNLENYRMENDQKRDAEKASNKSALYERQQKAAEAAEQKRQFDEQQKLAREQFEETKRANRQSEKDNAYTKLRDTTNGYDLGRVNKELKKLSKKKKLTKAQKQFKRLLLSRKGQIKEQIASEKRADKSAIKRMEAQAKINKKYSK